MTPADGPGVGSEGHEGGLSRVFPRGCEDPSGTRPRERGAGATLLCDARLGEWGAGTELVATCVLLVSELATNSVLHARTGFSVELVHDGALRVEVVDDDPRLPHLRDSRVDAASGRGMRMVTALARASGAQERAPGKAVWFELDWQEELAG